MGGNGSWWSTLGGCIVGGGLAFLPIAGGDKDAIIWIGIGALGGGITAYHLSASPVYEAGGIPTSSLQRRPNVETGLHALAPSMHQQNFQITVLSIKL